MDKKPCPNKGRFDPFGTSFVSVQHFITSELTLCTELDRVPVRLREFRPVRDRFDANGAPPNPRSDA